MKVFVTGVAGQLGHDVVNELVKRGHVAVGSDVVESAEEVSALTHLISQTLEVEQRSGELLSLADTVEKAAAEAMTLAEEASGRIAAAVSNANAAADRADKFPLVAQEAKQKAEASGQRNSEGL